ncbi:type II secretion system F family protein [Nodularia spumigena CS-584]|mgnify:CR=1 FL=1|jgi:type IV pilus assembly protein PilC|uniref:Type II secretion system F family protein n=1 Tax=Nodularia spumigena UHCC 0060 TaxID=3110300 RepID=A0ABU5UMA1_NODSP|nr:type II secretion system F family protein [Nodularia spumigena]AHJ28374.1 Type IV fimbrial assembly protein PilC [Nodularia spumigena CCY9414]EAW43960.1 pilin biogenesis protein [Nodularia spumigena CCY9414]MDB9349231.1 type II secretion system F family protein [Nodularia spumigena CS-588/01]MDB9352067.1 type II secretion system F family protein [Nodularia spumigena CS-588/05]MDB9384351.1 type II secretion system F family protein [Nodularia spumigena CS-584]
MPNYVARIRDSQGQSRNEKIVADSLSEARTNLRQQGFVVQDLKPSQNFSFDFQKFQMSMVKVTVKDKAVFSRQFAVLMNAGVAIVRSLGVLGEQCSNPRLKQALLEISNDVQTGMNLSESMQKHPECFDGLYVSMVQAGEIGGVLDDVLNRLAKLLEDVARLQNQIKSALSYPVVVGILATTIFVAMTVFLIPIFANIFADIGVELPALTQFLMLCSKILRSWWSLAIVGSFIVLRIVYQQYYKTPVGRLTIDRLSLKLPLFGDLIQKSSVARFSRTFGALTRSGVPILTCLEIVRDTSGNQVIANAIDAARLDIQQGGVISLALQKDNVFPIMAIQMMSIGEETGELDSMLMKVADFYEDEVEQAVKALTSVLEPVMIVVLGGMVGTILLAMYLPMFKVFETLG